MIRAVAVIMLVGLTGCAGPGDERAGMPIGSQPPASTQPSEGAHAQVTEYFPSFAGVRHEDMFRLADIVAVIRVLDRIDKAIGSDYVWRESQVELVKQFKGPAFGAIQQPGGAIPGREDVFHGVPYLEVGTTYLVFLDIGDIAGVPSIQFFADPAQLAYLKISGQYLSLDGGTQFSDAELLTLSRAVAP